MRVSIVGRSADKAAGPLADAPQGGGVNQGNTDES
jgi:hypothetical protein